MTCKELPQEDAPYSCFYSANQVDERFLDPQANCATRLVPRILFLSVWCSIFNLKIDRPISQIAYSSKCLSALLWVCMLGCGILWIHFQEQSIVFKINELVVNERQKFWDPHIISPQFMSLFPKLVRCSANNLFLAAVKQIKFQKSSFPALDYLLKNQET